MSQKFLTIVDTSAPFFLEHAKGTVNWSKAPLVSLEKNKSSFPSKKNINAFVSPSALIRKEYPNSDSMPLR